MNSRIWALILIVVLGCVWGSSFILIKRGLLAFEPVQVAGLRLAFAGFCLLPWFVKYSIWQPLHGQHNLVKADYAYLLLSGVIGNAIPAFLFSRAGQLIPSGLSGILNAFTPMFTLLFGVWWFGDKMTRNGALGVALGLAGAGILLGPTLLGQDHSLHLGGASMALFSAVLYGININIIKHKFGHLPGMVKTAYPFVFVGFLYLIVLAQTGLFDAVPVLDWQAPSQFWKSLGFVAILGVLGSALSMLAFNWVIKQTSALEASTNTFIIPVMAVIWGLVDSEALTWNMFVGLLLSLAAVYLVMRR
ncbi:MAG: DMT family transporter [Bacteroidia bacterium]